MTRLSNSKNVNKIIKSVKKTFVASLIGVNAISFTSCGAAEVKQMQDIASNVAKSVEDVTDIITSGAEKVKDINEGFAEKIDKIDRITIPSLFSEKKTFYAKETGKYDEEKKLIGGYATNEKLTIVGESEDGVWYETMDGYFVKKEETMENPITHVIKCETTIVYTQYENVRVHETPDKTSPVLITLKRNQEVAKTGELEFSTLSKIDSSGDHGWSEISYVKDGVTCVGYVYTDYVDTEETTVKKEALEVPAYTDAEKQSILQAAKDMKIDFKEKDIKTDEDYYELNAQREREVIMQEADDYLAAWLEGLTAGNSSSSGSSGSSSSGSSSSSSNFITEHANDTWSTTRGAYVPRPYDHSQTKAIREENDRQAAEHARQEQEAIEAFNASHGGLVSETWSDYHYVTEYEGANGAWGRTYVKVYADGFTQYGYVVHNY